MPTLRRAALLLVLPALLAACSGSQPSGSAGHPATAPTPSAAPAGGTVTTQPTSAPAGATFACSDRRSGGKAGLEAQLTDVRVAAHPGFDRITFQFAPAGSSPASGQTGVPAYQLQSQASPSFTKDASGLRLQLAGSAGLRIVFQGTSDFDSTMPTGPQTYRGSLDIRSTLPAVREVTQLGDFERVLSWGAGLASPACLRTTELSNPARVVIDFRTS